MKKNVLLLALVAMLMPWALGAQEFPKISENTDYWYSIYSHRSEKVLKNAGIDVIAESAAFVAGQADLQWKFKLDAKGSNGIDTFKIVSKTGGELKYIGYLEVTPGEGAYFWDSDSNDGVGGYVKLTQNHIDNGQIGTHNLVNRFVTATTDGTRFVFTTFGSDASGFKFQLKTITPASYLNMTNPGDGSNYTIYGYNNDGGNQFSVIENSLQEIEDGLDALYTASFPDAPVMSTAASPVYYQIRNLRKNRVFQTNEDGSVMIEPGVSEAGTKKDAQLFRFEGTLRSFKIISKTGGGLSYDATSAIFVKSDGDGDDFKIDRMTAGTYTGKLVIFQKAKNTGVNGMHSYKLTLYNGTHDDGNAVDFIAEDYNPFSKAPQLSTAANPVWYLVKNTRSGNVIYYNTEVNQIYQGSISAEFGRDRDVQLFRFEGTYKDGFKIISKEGGKLQYDESSKKFGLTESAGSTFKFVEKDADSQTWNIQYEATNNGLNAHSSSLDIVSIYSIDDSGSIWMFLPDDYNAFVNAPELSTENAPIWYQIQNVRNTKVLYYKDNSDTKVSWVQQQDAEIVAGEAMDLQLFRFEGSYKDGVRIIAKTGGEFILSSIAINENTNANRFALAGTYAGSTFKFIEKNAADNTWIIQYDNEETGINAHDSNMTEVTTYYKNDAGSVWKFIKQNASTGNNTLKDNSKIGLSMSNGNLTVKAPKMDEISIYNLTGTKISLIDVNGDSFSTTINPGSVYILSVKFMNGSVENIKFIAK